MESTLVLARPEDCETVWQINNDPQARQWSTSDKPIPWEDHVRWYHKALASNFHTIFMIMEGTSTVGVVRFQQIQEEAYVSITITPEAQGRGHGKRSILSGALKMRSAGFKGDIIAIVKPTHQASKSMLIKANFITSGHKEVEGVVFDKFTFTG